MDNTWASPLYFRAFDKGVDLVDPGRHQIYRRPFRRDARHRVGQCQATGTRLDRHGLHAWACASARTTCISACAACAPWAVRLAHHIRRGWQSRAGSTQRPEVARVLHPALESCPGHAIWQRDFTGACGLFSIVLKPVPQAAVARLPRCARRCSASARRGAATRAWRSRSIATPSARRPRWAPGGPTVRFHIGLEDVDDLIADLERGFAALAAAR